MTLTLNQVKTIALKTAGSRLMSDHVQVFTDTRDAVPNGLFIPITGERFDGHAFLLQAIQSGAIASLWENGKEVPHDLPSDFILFVVEDTLKAMQELAKLYLNQVQPKVIAITGSNGKTTTKDLVSSVVSTVYRTHATKGNFNNHIGLPLTILSMSEDCEVLVLEMGMNHFGEISLLSKIAEPHLSVITNIGESHIEFLGSREGIAKAKLEILDGMNGKGLLIADGDEPLLLQEDHATETLYCGFSEKNNYFISDIEPGEKGYKFQINNKDHVFHIQLIGTHNVKNAAYAVAVGRALQMSDHEIQKGFDILKMTGMRLETVAGKNGTLLINDSYNASPTSMSAAIDTIKNLPEKRKRVIVLGNMYELGQEEEALHRKVAESITAPISDVILIGDKAKWIGEEVMKRGQSLSISMYDQKEKALEELEKLLGPDTVILFKASRLAALETLVESLKK